VDIAAVLAEVRRDLLDACGQQRDLNLGAARVTLFAGEVLDDLLLLFNCNGMDSFFLPSRTLERIGSS
jgi:hypothetical protein